ncbi:MAG: carboxypeptidase regulatory-like domain-containing protein [Gemmatimonadota bacterium]|nr:carboxypeptidase regulatory-like domain-containing protein [Gemmatimonadota bacterium]
MDGARPSAGPIVHRALSPASLARVIGSAMVAVLAGAAVASAQAGSVSPVTFSGEVLDTYRGEPVEGAIVRLEGTLRPDGSIILGITDEMGRFDITDVPPGPSQVLVSRIGYADLVQVLDIREGQFVEIAVIPKPIVLEGIEVYVDRLTTRLRELPYLTNTYDEAALRFAPDFNVAQFLHSQPAFEFVPCFEDLSTTSPFTQRRDCMRTRGTTPQRPRVFVDDAPAFGGVQELATLPTSEIYRVEVIRGCGQIRVYTVTYVEGIATRPRPLIPIVC